MITHNPVSAKKQEAKMSFSDLKAATELVEKMFRDDNETR